MAIQFLKNDLYLYLMLTLFVTKFNNTSMPSSNDKIE